MREKTLVRVWWSWVAVASIVVVGMLAIVIRHEVTREKTPDAWKANARARHDEYHRVKYMTTEEAEELIERRRLGLGVSFSK